MLGETRANSNEDDPTKIWRWQALSKQSPPARKTALKVDASSFAPLILPPNSKQQIQADSQSSHRAACYFPWHGLQCFGHHR